MNVAAALMSLLRAGGVRYLFGNPGTTELPFLDALPESGIDYVLGLQEATVVAAADGYAQASGRLGVANVHVGPGLANGLSILHNAARARTPLLVTAGQQDSRFLHQEPILAAGLVQMTEQFTKWSYEVRGAADAIVALQRAMTLALAPPTGPVFLSLPMDVMTAEAGGGAAATVGRAAATRVDAESVERAAALLAGARAPVVIAGDGVARAGAMPALVRLAGRLGARVHAEPIHRRTSFPDDHPLWRGGLYPAPGAVRKALADGGVALIVGADVFTWFLYAPGSPFPPGLTVVQLDDDPGRIGRNYPVTLGMAGDIAHALDALDAGVAARMTEAQRAAAVERTAVLGRTRAEYARRLRADAEAGRDRVPVTPAFLMHTLASLLPDGAVIVDESASSLPHVLRHLPARHEHAFFGSKTGTLGWAAGAAVGVQLALPARKVVVTIGDGSLMYAPQALWTAAHRRLPITYVVLDNASYAILKSGMATLGLPSAKRGLYPGMDLVDPEIDRVALARALGVRAERVDKPRDLADALAAALAHPGPALVDVAIDRGFEPMA